MINRDEALMNRVFLILSFIFLFTGSVWDHLSQNNTDLLNKRSFAQSLQNPFLAETVLQQGKSIINFSLVDKLKSRKV